jgi:IS5 family transposase
MYRGSGNLEEEFEEKMAQLDEKHAELEKEELYRIELEAEYKMEKKAEKAIDRYRNQY